MHWLDSAPSREIDPVLDCLTFLARRADRPSSPVLLRAGLALSDNGHAAVPPDRAGARAGWNARRARFPAAGFAGWRLQQLPAIVELTEDRAIVLLEMKARRRAGLRARHGRADVGSGLATWSRSSPATPSRSRPIRRRSAPANARGTRSGEPTGSGPKCGRSAANSGRSCSPR